MGGCEGGFLRRVGSARDFVPRVRHAAMGRGLAKSLLREKITNGSNPPEWRKRRGIAWRAAVRINLAEFIRNRRGFRLKSFCPARRMSCRCAAWAARRVIRIGVILSRTWPRKPRCGLPCLQKTIRQGWRIAPSLPMLLEKMAGCTNGTSERRGIIRGQFNYFEK